MAGKTGAVVGGLIGFVLGGRLGATVGAALGYAAAEAFGSGPVTVGAIEVSHDSLAGVLGLAIKTDVSLRGQIGVTAHIGLHVQHPDGRPVAGAIPEFRGVDQELFQSAEVEDIPSESFTQTIVFFVPYAAFEEPAGHHRLIFKIEAMAGAASAKAQVSVDVELPGHRRAAPKSMTVAEPVLELMVGLMKADGRVHAAEVREIRRFFERIDKEPAFLDDIRRRTKELLKTEIDVTSACRRLRASTRSMERELVLRVLFTIAAADGELAARELSYMRQVATLLGFGRTEFERLRIAHGPPQLDDHQVLGVPRGASKAQLKAAYRQACLKFHPDRLSDRSADEKRRAGEQFIRIKEAYERLLRQT